MNGTMTEEQARIWLVARDSFVKRVSKMGKAQLAIEYGESVTLLYGGPATKDEYVSALVSSTYPNAKHNECIHVLYHVDGITNDACEHCDA